MIVATGEVLACFRLRGGLSGKLRLDCSAKHCALLSVFGSRSIVFVLLSPGRIPSELLVVSAAGGLSVRGVQKSSVTCQLVPLASPERDLTHRRSNFLSRPLDAILELCKAKCANHRLNF